MIGSCQINIYDLINSNFKNISKHKKLLAIFLGQALFANLKKLVLFALNLLNGGLSETKTRFLSHYQKMWLRCLIYHIALFNWK